MGIDPKNRDDPKRPDIAAVTFSDCGSRGRGFDPVTHPNLNPAHAGSQGCGDVSGFTDGNSICENSISSATEGQKAGSQATALTGKGNIRPGDSADARTIQLCHVGQVQQQLPHPVDDQSLQMADQQVAINADCRSSLKVQDGDFAGFPD